jgi:hypothetical protein
VTPGGTANTINDIGAASGDATAALRADVQDALYQVGEELRIIKAALKANGYIKT